MSKSFEQQVAEWVSIAKGGSGSGRYPAGSSHTKGTLGGEAVRLSNFVQEKAKNFTPDEANATIEAHEVMADLHKQLANAMADDDRAVQANLKAADAHYKAAATIARKMGEWAQPNAPEAQALAGYDAPKATASQVVAASKAATVASLDAQKLSQENEGDKVYIGGSLALGYDDPYGDIVAKGGEGSGRFPAGSSTLKPLKWQKMRDALYPQNTPSVWEAGRFQIQRHGKDSFTIHDRTNPFEFMRSFPSSLTEAKEIVEELRQREAGSSEIVKGGSGSGRFPKGQHAEVASRLRQMADEAKANSWEAPSSNKRMNTDVLGRTYRPQYGETAKGQVRLANYRIDRLARQMADTIEGDTAKQISEHIEEARASVSAMLQDASWNSSVDNYDTARGLRDDAAIMDGLANLVAREFPTAPPATVEQPSADLKSFMDEHFIFTTVGFKKGGEGSGRYKRGSGEQRAIQAVIQNIGVNGNVFADRTIGDADAHASFAKEHLAAAKDANSAQERDVHMNAAIAHQEAYRAHLAADRLFRAGTTMTREGRAWVLDSPEAEEIYAKWENANSVAKKATDNATVATIEADGNPTNEQIAQELSLYGIDPSVMSVVADKGGVSSTLAEQAKELALRATGESAKYSPTPVVDSIDSLADQSDEHLQLIEQHGALARELASQATSPLEGGIEPLNASLLLEASKAHLEAAEAHGNAGYEISMSLPVDYYAHGDIDLDDDRILDDIRLDQDEQRAIDTAVGAVQVAATASARALEATRRANSLA